MSWKKYFTPVDNAGLPFGTNPTQGGDTYGASATSRYSSWLPEVYQGSPDRLMRYMQYDQMDRDLEVNAALDTISEFSTQVSEKSKTPYEIHYNDDPSDSEVKIITEKLEQWCRLNQLNRRTFGMFRGTVKYGDQVFIRDPETFKLYWVDPANVEKVVVNESKGKKIDAYFIKNVDFHLKDLAATNYAPSHNRPYGSGAILTDYSNPTSTAGYIQGTDHGSSSTSMPIPAEHVVHLSLAEGMEPTWPFGSSILDPIFKVFKQKELLEDSIIIYRVHRAPERRVFFIDVGNMPPHKAQQYLEKVRYEVQQKRIPSKNSQGGNVVDSSYNPMSMLEDYFFATTAEGRGSKVDTLPGGDNLGEIDDLKYFNNKLLRGLRIPTSYLPTGPDDGTGTYNDGKVGVAYIQEYRFTKYCQRLQNTIIREIDREFKRYLKHSGFEIDAGLFSIGFADAQNFASYRDLEIDTARAQVFGQLEGIPYLSTQFKLKKYLGLSEKEILENEKHWREENGEDYVAPDGDNLRQVGVTPQTTSGLTPELGPDLAPDEGAPIDPLAPGGDINTTEPGTEPGI